jgi:RNA polymerase sigma-70 factor (ECF subfamily)
MAAWQGLGGFDGRASLRRRGTTGSPPTGVSTRVVSASRRPAKEWDIAEYRPPEPTRFGEIVVARAVPRRAPRGRHGRAAGAGGPYEQARDDLPRIRDRSPSFARLASWPCSSCGDVLGFHATMVAEMLDTTIDSVNSLLKTGSRRPPAPTVDRCRSRTGARPQTGPPSRRRWRSSSARTSPATSTP